MIFEFHMSYYSAGGLVRHALEMFDEFKYVADHVKTETIEFSLTVLQICIRSVSMASITILCMK